MSFFHFNFCRRSAVVPLLATMSLAANAPVEARNLIGNASSSASSAQSGSASASATSQTATAATTAAAQAAQAAVVARRAQDSLVKSTAAFQTIAAAQAAARLAAINNPSNILTSTDGSNLTDGLGVGLLNPVGGVPATKASSAIQVIDLGNSGKNSLVLGSGGNVTLPSGTAGSDQVTVSGAGTVTTSSGTVSVTAGTVSTTVGGTLAATSGGTIALTAGSGTLSATTSTTLTSSLAGTVTLPAGGGTIALSANQAITVPAGSQISFSGSGTANVSISGAGTVALAGAGTLALANATGGTGGTINTSSGTTSFTGSGTIASQTAGTTISLNGGGAINFSGSGSDILPVIVQPTAATQAPPAFTTTGTVLSTQGYNIPSTWSLGTGGALSQSVANGGQTTVTITQTQQQALLYWQSFNIGKNTVLDFDQSAGGASAGNWVAINRILDPTLAPSQILGAIEAPGQVYVINQNGIIFNGSSQINTHALVASTLPINSNLVASGLLNNPTGQFLFTSEAIVPLNNATPYDPSVDTGNTLVENGGVVGVSGSVTGGTVVPSGNITVQQGAILSSPGSPEGVGGKIALIAPTVDNEGMISAPDGQIILAAGQQVGFAAHPSSDPSLRGLDVGIGAVNGNESVSNGVNGLILAPEADVTMTAPTVIQNGEIDGTTSVSLNARIDLLAVSGLTPDPQNSFLLDAVENGSAVGGTVTLGANSLTEILPDYASTDTQVGTSLALPSQVYVEGSTFHMATNSQLIAPNATATFSMGILNTPISLSAAQRASVPLPTPVPENTGASTVDGSQKIVAFNLSTPGQVTLDAGANLDVSGTSNVQASVLENIVQAQLTEAVLENSALQETGPLRGQTVTVDVSQTGTNADGSTWFGSPIGDLSGYANLVEHTVGELTVAGGNIAINTNGSVVTSPTSTINVSGGSIDYQGAMVQTSVVITSTGQMVSIANATPDQTYLGVDNGSSVSSSKWGFTQTFSNPLQSGTYYDSSYVTGGSGGSLTISTQSASLGGALYGNTTTGVRQQTVPPVASSFGLTINNNPGVNPPTVTVVIQANGDAQVSDPSLIYLSPDLFGVDGFSNASINTGSGNVDYTSTAARQGSAIDIAADAVISTAPGGSLSLTSANINMDGKIYSPSGTVTLTALPKDTLDAQQSAPTPFLPSIGNVDVAAGAVIATTGLAFDATSSSAPTTLPFSVNGGTITISGAVTTIDGGTALAAAASLDASGGAILNPSNKLINGKGGTISLTGLYNGGDANPDGSLTIDGSLTAYGVGGQGGTLNLKAPAVVVGNGPVPTFVGTQSPLVIADPKFFSQGGFSSFSLTGSGGVQILDGTVIAPVLTEEISVGKGAQFGIDLVSSATLPQFPAAPVNLSFSAPSSTGDALATLTLGTGASIVTGATGSVSLTGQLVNILGSVTAPGGTITVTGDSTAGLGEDNVGTLVPPVVTVDFGSSATLSVSGEVLTTPVPVGYQVYHTGQVFNGGTITVTGNIVGDTHASLLADGAVGNLDVPIASAGIGTGSTGFARSSNPYVNETIGSNGGSITFNGLEELSYNGRLSAQAGNAAAIGGTLTVSSGLATSYTQPPAAGYAELVVTTDIANPNQSATLGQSLPGAPDNGGGRFAIKQFDDGGFGSLILEGNVEFEGGTAAAPIVINASQKVEIIPDSQNGTIFADGSNETITINAPYIAIGATSLDFINGQTVTSNAPYYVGTTTTVTSSTYNPGTNTVSSGSSTVTQPATPVPGLVDPTFGQASLSLHATDLIDVGFLSLQNFGTTTFSVPTGDIRGGGLFYASGVINLQAGQIYTSTAATFTVAAFDDASQVGTINILPGVTRPLPLSAGGTINIYATDINQDGVIEAPFGTINLGALPDSSTGLTPVLAGVTSVLNSNTLLFDQVPDYTQHAPETKQLTLGSTSITSVSGVSASGEVLDLPYGTILNGGQWIAPNGADITAGGLPAKVVNLKADNVTDQSGALVDLQGGGDLFAYQFSPGVGGTNDVLNIFKYANGAVVVNSSAVPQLSTSFAILPAYGINYDPIDLTVDSNVTTPYANANLTGNIGSDIYLAGGDGLAAGVYAILPARYALLPGAYLVTPSSNAAPTQTSVNPDGSLTMAGYSYNGLSQTQNLPNVTGFQVASSAIVHTRAEYDISSANTFLSASAIANSKAVPRLPIDAGQLVFNATTGLDIEGSLLGQAAAGGLGSTVDIGSTDDIYIVSNSGDAPTLTVPNGVNPADYTFLTLSATALDAFGADSLLIGGTRSVTGAGTLITPTTNAIYVENTAAAPLTGNEIVLASNETISLDSGSSIKQSGVVSTGGENYIIGNAATPGSGDGTLVRVTGDPNATFTRLGVDTTDTIPQLNVKAGASIGGVSVTLDSSSGAAIDPAAAIDQGVAGQALVLSSSAISLQIDPTVSLASAPGLVIDNSTLQTLETSVARFSLSSYSTINLYGAGTLGGLDASGKPVVGNLSLQGAGIFGFGANGGTVTLNAQTVSINNTNNQALSGTTPTLPAGANANSLVINAGTINLGANSFAIDGYSTTTLNASNEIVASGAGGLVTQGALNMATPFITATAGAKFGFTAQGGALDVTKPTAAATSAVAGGLGATLSFTGATVDVASEISTPSGTIQIDATSGNVEVASGGDLDATGQAVVFGSATSYTNGGTVSLTSAQGAVMIDSGSRIDVSAQSGGGNAGTVNISTASGQFIVADGTLKGTAGTNGTGGVFNASLQQVGTLSAITTPVIDGGFQSVALDVLTGNVTVDSAVGPAIGQNGLGTFSLTTEQGGIIVNASINASGVTGGTIDLYADQGVAVNAALSVAGQKFDNAGKGGVIDIETRGAGGGTIDIGASSSLDLSIAGAAGGVLDLRAPQTSGNTGLLIDKLTGAIINPSAIIAEGYAVFTPTNGTIDSVESAVGANVTTFGNNTGAVGQAGSITDELVGGTVNAGYASTSASSTIGAVLHVQPGEEIINPSGNLVLNKNWDLSSLRTASGEPGDLTIRAAGNITFNGSLTDGFAYNAADSENVQGSPYTWDVIAGPSWSYRLVAGAQFTAGASTANFGSVQSLAALGLTTNDLTNSSLQAGSLLLGQVIPLRTSSGAPLQDGILTATIASTYAQLIRTGTGNITIDTGGSVDLMNQLATIYTAGSLAPTLPGFASPTGGVGANDSKYETESFGTPILAAPQYTAQYTQGGGNVSIDAQQDIAHLTLAQDANGNMVLVANTSWQFPTNWLYRRGATSSTGVFDTTKLDPTELATTTWWIDFSNFFEGIGALGGGNVTVSAGGNIVNVDAVVPTNARMPFADASGNPVADVASNLVELGGGNLNVSAGGTIEGGTYYVEQGTGMITANSITSTGDTARISGTDLKAGNDTPLPLTLFVGDSTFTVQSTNDLSFGSAVNPFLLPQGIGNNINNESIFSTYSATSAVNLSSLLGSVTVQGSQFEGIPLSGSLYDAYFANSSPAGLKARGFTQEQNDNSTLGLSGPWSLTIVPGQNPPNGIDDVRDYSTFFAFSPPIFGVTAFSGNIQYQSDQLLAPSSKGTLQLLAAGSVDGAFNTTSSSITGVGLTSSITVLDDDPSQLPNITSPLGFGHSTVEPRSVPNDSSIDPLIVSVTDLLAEAPSIESLSIPALDSFHTPGLLHAGSTTPVQIETINGDIGDFTLITPEETEISAGLDLQDVSLYLQNNNANDVSIVSANRDITLFDPNSAALVSLGAANSFYTAFGDLQIGGPGSLEVVAGRNLTLGEGTSQNAFGLAGVGLGITSIGNSRDPFLPAAIGANIIAAAGVGDSSGLTSNPQLVNEAAINSAFLDQGSSESSIYLPDLGALLGLSGATNSQISDIYTDTADATLTPQQLQIQASLTPEERAGLATTIFYDVLRDSARGTNETDGGVLSEGFSAIKDLFPNTGHYQGDISVTSREIKTTNVGDIDLLIPGGGLNVGTNNLGTQAIDQGILTVAGGNISIFANNDITIGTSRIFTLHGGNIIIWSTVGNIDAGASSRTVQSAPPTRVLVDTTSANVETDLAGLATGGGIGVLETVVGAPPGDVDLIAPNGAIISGDAGVRASGNLHLKAQRIVGSNFQAGGTTTGGNVAAAPNVTATVAASNAAGSAQSAATTTSNRGQDNDAGAQQDIPSIISVEVIGYGGGDSASNEPQKLRDSANATYVADRP